MDFPIDSLSKRERMVAERYAGGETYRDIADSLCIAPATVRSHIASIYRKLEIQHKPALISVLSQETVSQTSPHLLSQDKPSLTVLPFANLSTDPDNDYFVEGITEEIMTSLSRFRGVIVTSYRASILASEQTMDACEAAKNLGVQYALNGSIRRSGERVRVTATLFESDSGLQIWSENYERVLDDIFQVQDDVAQRIVTMLVGKIEQSDHLRSVNKKPCHLTAYECVLQGRHYFGDWRGSKDGVMKARKMFEKAIEIDPRYAAAYSGISATYCEEFEKGWSDDLDTAGDLCIEFAQKAIELDEHDSLPHLMLSSAYWHVRKDFELARRQLEIAIELNPNYYWSYCYGCWFSACAGDLEVCIRHGTEAIRRNPLLPNSCLSVFGLAEYLSENYEKAIETLCQIDKLDSKDYACLAASYAQLDRLDEVDKIAEEFFKLCNYDSMSRDDWYSFWALHFDFKEQGPIDHLIEGLERSSLVSR